ncbi:MAG TPA: hypothetical protein VGE13_00870 [Candidatus Saccharimonadales bacterium]
MTYKDIDFRELEPAALFPNPFSTKQRAIDRKPSERAFVFLVFVLMFFLVGGFWVLYFIFLTHGADSLASGLGSFGIIFVVAVLSVVQRRLIVHAKRFHRFARANGWKPHGQPPSNPFFQTNGFRFTPSLVTGEFLNARFWIHGVAKASTKGHRDYFLQTMAIEVPEQLPTLVLIPRSNSVETTIAPLFASNVDLKPLQLEGDFNTYMAVYYRPGEHIESLAYLTPDVMQVLVDDPSSIIIYAGRYIYIASKGSDVGIARTKQMFIQAERLIPEVRHKQHAQ